jgi:hypothetical protein
VGFNNKTLILGLIYVFMSFSFFLKKKQQPLFDGLIDFHNHLLPGIDDGSKSVDQSMEMLDLYADLGIKKSSAARTFIKIYTPIPKRVSKLHLQSWIKPLKPMRLSYWVLQQNI